MKKVSLLLALALALTMVFAGCGYTNQPETFDESETSVVSGDSDDAIAHDIVNTTWVLTNFGKGKTPVESPVEDLSEERPEPLNLPSGEEIAGYMSASLEFKEDNKVTMTTNFASKELTYSHIYNQENKPCISVTDENNNTFTGVIEDDTMTFMNITGSLMIFEKQ